MATMVPSQPGCYNPSDDSVWPFIISHKCADRLGSAPVCPSCAVQIPHKGQKGLPGLWPPSNQPRMMVRRRIGANIAGALRQFPASATNPPSITEFACETPHLLALCPVFPLRWPPSSHKGPAHSCTGFGPQGPRGGDDARDHGRIGSKTGHRKVPEVAADRQTIMYMKFTNTLASKRGPSGR